MLSNQRGCIALPLFVLGLFAAAAVGAWIGSSGLPEAIATGYRWAFALTLLNLVATAAAIITEPGDA